MPRLNLQLDESRKLLLDGPSRSAANQNGFQLVLRNEGHLKKACRGAALLLLISATPEAHHRPPSVPRDAPPNKLSSRGSRGTCFSLRCRRPRPTPPESGGVPQSHNFRQPHFANHAKPAAMSYTSVVFRTRPRFACRASLVKRKAGKSLAFFER